MKLEEAIKVSEVTNRLDDKYSMVPYGRAKLTYTFTRTIVVSRNTSDRWGEGKVHDLLEHDPTQEELQQITNSEDWEPV